MEFALGIVFGLAAASVGFGAGWINGFTANILAKQRLPNESMEDYARRLSRG